MGKISEIFNFDDIGGKIKNFAKWSCWITILVLWFASALLFVITAGNSDDLVSLLIPIVVAIAGPFAIWVSSWILYAFGQLVEDNHGNKASGSLHEKEASIEQEPEEKTGPSAKAKKCMEQGIQPSYQGYGYICPSCKMTMDYIAPCERCGYIPPQSR